MEWTHESPPVNLRKYSSPCIACSLAESKRQSHSRKIKVPIELGPLVYVNIWRPCQTALLINEYNYTIGFIDEATDRARLLFRKKKSDILGCVQWLLDSSVIAKRGVSQ